MTLIVYMEMIPSPLKTRVNLGLVWMEATGRHMVNNGGYRAAGTTDSGDHTDKDEVDVSSIIWPSVLIVTTCQGMSLPLC